jgi:predicted nucleic acid-binding protein
VLAILRRQSTSFAAASTEHHLRWHPLVPAEDVPIVSAALEGGAEYLVSDDAGLLDLKMVSVSGYRPVQVIAPGPFVKQVLQIEPSQG